MTSTCFSLEKNYFNGARGFKKLKNTTPSNGTHKYFDLKVLASF